VKEEKPKATGRGERELRLSARKYIKIAVTFERNVSGEFML
jgi:hypothetical protein